MASVFTQNNKKRVLNMVNPKASLSPSLLPLPLPLSLPLSLSLSPSLSLTLAMRNLLFSPAIFFRGMYVKLSMFSFPYIVIVGCLFAIRVAAGTKGKRILRYKL